MKKIIKVVLTLAVMSVMITSVFAVSPEADFRFSESGGEVTVTRYIGSSATVQIPASIGPEGNKKPVKVVGEGAFRDCSSLTSVVIPNSIITIGDSAFRDCSSLASIALGNSVTTIGDSAFYRCYDLTSVTIPNSVTNIGTLAFYACESLETLKIGNSVAVIGKMAFASCTSLTSVVIPDSLSVIDSATFQGCSSLASVTLGDSVTTIGNYAFNGCDPLESITIPNSVTDIGDSAFAHCVSLKEITIPDSVKTIGMYAFRWCSSLESVNLPSSLTNIAINTFMNCDSLTSVTIPNSVVSIEAEAFEGCSALESVDLPSTVTTIGGAAFAGCSSLTTVNYGGDSANKEQIEIRKRNTELLNATWNYSSYPPDSSLVSYSVWAEPHVAFARNNSLIVDSLLNDYTVNITRFQIADLLVNMIEQYSGQTLSVDGAVAFIDTDSPTAKKANAAGIISGKDGNLFDGTANATRQEMAVMVYKAIVKMEQMTNTSLIDHNSSNYDFTDSASIDSWATDAVYVLAHNGIMRGSDNGFDPTGSTTIEQSFVLGNNLFRLEA